VEVQVILDVEERLNLVTCKASVLL